MEGFESAHEPVCVFDAAVVTTITVHHVGVCDDKAGLLLLVLYIVRPGRPSKQPAQPAGRLSPEGA